MSRPAIAFFTDENVPESVGDAILLLKHDLVRMRDVMPRASTDPLVALTAWTNDRVLVSHDNDFRAVAQRLELTKRELREKMHRIQLRCAEPNAAARLTEAIGLIEYEWLHAGHSLRPMIIEIRDLSIRTLR